MEIHALFRFNFLTIILAIASPAIVRKTRTECHVVDNMLLSLSKTKPSNMLQYICDGINTLSMDVRSCTENQWSIWKAQRHGCIYNAPKGKQA